MRISPLSWREITLSHAYARRGGNGSDQTEYNNIRRHATRHTPRTAISGWWVGMQLLRDIIGQMAVA